MEKMIEVIKWETDGADAVTFYRLDEQGEGERFFRDLRNNAENDGRETITFGEVTEAEWAQIEAEGQRLA